jgi:hypothetical protein
MSTLVLRLVLARPKVIRRRCVCVCVCVCVCACVCVCVCVCMCMHVLTPLAIGDRADVASALLWPGPALGAAADPLDR